MSPASLSTGRIERLAGVLRDKGLDAYMATSAFTMGYLSGYREEGGERLLTLVVSKDGRSALVAPALSSNQASRFGFKDLRRWTDGEDPLALVASLAEEYGFSRGGIAVDDEARAALVLAMQATLPGARFVPGQPVLSELVRVKDHSELDLLRRAGAIADGALAPVLAQVRPGWREWDVHEALQREMRALGGEPNFCIVATGAHGAEPHHGTDQTIVQDGDVLVLDYGCSVGGYMSDITRTVVVGEPTEEQRKVYGIVNRAHLAAREAVRPGVTAESVDSAARKVIEDAGYGEFFVHRTGHGLGTRIHEEPYICAGNRFQLEVGNVFSIEPGIYLPGRFGVRIENIVAVTEDGHENLNAEASETLLSVGQG